MRSMAVTGPALAGLAFLLSACASAVLPSETQVQASRFQTYADAEAAYAAVVPMATTEEELKALGIDAATQPNITVLNYLDVRGRFLAQQTVGLADLDPAVQACVTARTACTGIFAQPGALARERVGDVSLDLLGFRKETLETGWKAEMLFLLVDGVVIYKLWSGTPNLEARKTQTNPLGPLQDLSGAAGGAIRDVIR